MIYDAQGVQQEEREEEPTENLHAGGSSPERMDPDSPDRSPSGQQQPRDKWANKSEFLFSMAGVINGLENVWIFPYLCYENGGGAFFIPYFATLLFCGMPIFFLETALGQYTSEGGVTAWRKICPMFEGIGIASQVIVSYLNVYYIVMLAWAVMYLFNSFKSPLPWATCDNSWNTMNCQNTTMDTGIDSYNNISRPEEEFWRFRLLRENDEGLGPVNGDLALCLLLVWVVCYFCIWKGIKSMGKVVYFTATFPHLMLFILLIRGVTLPGAMDGIKYYLYPNLHRIADIRVWVDAGTHVLFSLTVCQGVPTALGSYNKYNNNCYNDCIGLCILNTCTSIFAGFVVFSVLGFMAHVLGMPVEDVVQIGPGLAFIAFPRALALLPGAQFWCVLFFLMVLLLGLNVQFVCVESLATAISDLFPVELRSKKKGRQEILVLVIATVCFLLGLPFITQGGIYLLHTVDLYAFSKCSLLFIACLESVVIAWIYGADRFYDNIEDMIGCPPFPVLKYCWLFISPLICGVLLFLNVYSPFDPSLPWGTGLGFVLMLTPLMCIPVFILVALLKVSNMLSPSSELRQVRPHKARLTLCGYVIIDGQRLQTTRSCAEEDKVLFTNSV
ncbi:sodium- and chloride-dependent betaine transporter-like [Clupea harengus]|uniref:Sodium- and chloride-dependent betaine transporter-like n=1 Tax=Clupea harengus TaxID=7950 RepID=A0A6P8GS10_CLUHA|nr:sodium- and chloride-dependent betaine transporter-like [Clupea harengus]